MNIVRYEPWGLMHRFRNEVDRRFHSRFGWPWEEEEAELAGRCWSPAVDIEEAEDKYVLTADVPGVDPKDIDITLQDGTLTIQGERHEEKKEERKGFTRVERRSGKFSRQFRMPEGADAEQISAKSDNGVLVVTIPKAAASKPRRVEVTH